MKKYQIFEIAENFNHAGTKATADFAEIAEKIGYERVIVRMNTTKEGLIPKVQRQAGFFLDWEKAYRRIEADSVVLLQHPFHYPQLTRNHILSKLREKKNVRFISVIHDVEKLRGYRYSEYYRKEFEFMTKIADVIIVHNRKMAQYFIDEGYPEEKLVCLEIFDYLQPQGKREMPQFEKSLTVAGNLDVNKAQYIGQLSQLPYKVNLFGPNCSDSLKNAENVQYHGSFPSDVIPSKLDRGFGLVWDGSSINGCEGYSGQYLKYNNPHKLSLYLSSGLPVVIWNDAAEASFVKENQAGICVDSLENLASVFDGMDEAKYMAYASNAAVIAERLKNGYYGEHAVENAERLLGIK